MTPFQWIAGGFLVTALAIEISLQLLGMTRMRVSLSRSSVWACALTLVLYPDLLQSAALRLRIGRGTDFLLYMLALSFPVACFYFLHAIEQQRQQLTRLVRELAQRSPVHAPVSLPNYGEIESDHLKCGERESSKYESSDVG